MKNKKRHYLTMIVAFVMALFGITTSDAIAATSNASTGDGSIVINTTDDINLSKQKFQAYRLFTAEKISSKEERYTIIPEWQPFFNDVVSNKSGKDCTSEEAVQFLSKLKYNPGKLNQFADDAYKFAESHNIHPVGTPTPEESKYTISNLPHGYYLVSDVSNGQDIKAVSQDILVTVDSSIPVQVTLKADSPTLIKTINGSKICNDYNIGDDIPFTLMIKIPSMEGYTNYNLTLNDTLGTGLTFNNDLKVMVNGREYKNYQLDQDKQKITLRFAKDNQYNAEQDNVLSSNAGKMIKITYTAKLNNNAVLGGTGNTNIANLTYSNNPYSNTTHTTPNSKVTVYTYGLDITKQNSNGTKLQGAVFELKDKSGNVIKVKKTSDGNYVTDASGNDGNAITTDNQGKILVKGLKDGDYQLVETKAPDGYNKLKAPLQFSIVSTFGGKDLQTLTNLNVEGQDKDKFKVDKNSGIISTTIVNTTGGLLPKTGGRGIIVLSIIGILCIALATIIMLRRRKATK